MSRALRSATRRYIACDKTGRPITGFYCPQVEPRINVLCLDQLIFVMIRYSTWVSETEAPYNQYSSNYIKRILLKDRTIHPRNFFKFIGAEVKFSEKTCSRIQIVGDPDSQTYNTNIESIILGNLQLVRVIGFTTRGVCGWDCRGHRDKALRTALIVMLEGIEIRHTSRE